MAYESISTIFIVAVSLGAVVGCGDDGTAETGAMGSSGTDTGGTSTPASTGDTTPTSLGDSTAATSMMTGTTVAATEGTTEGETEGMETTAGETEGSLCEGLDRRQCATTEGCMPIGGTPVLMMGDGLCLGGPEYIECQPATGCGDAITYACEGDDGTRYEFIDTCIPRGWVSCGDPPGPLDPCPE